MGGGITRGGCFWKFVQSHAGYGHGHDTDTMSMILLPFMHYLAGKLPYIRYQTNIQSLSHSDSSAPLCRYVVGVCSVIRFVFTFL